MRDMAEVNFAIVCDAVFIANLLRCLGEFLAVGMVLRDLHSLSRIISPESETCG